MSRLSRQFRPLYLVLLVQAVLGSPTAAADFTIGAGQEETSARKLAAGIGRIEEDAKLSVQGQDPAIDVLDGVSEIDNAGTIAQSGSGRAIDANDGKPDLTVRNHATGEIRAIDNDAIRLNRKETQLNVDNAGLIVSGKSGILISGDSTSAKIRNTGNIEATGRGIQVDADEVHLNVINDGQLISDNRSILVGGDDATLEVVNEGTMQSRERVIHVNGDNATVMLNNAGSMRSDSADESTLHLNSKNGEYIINNTGTLSHVGTKRVIDIGDGQRFELNNGRSGTIVSSGAQTIRLSAEDGHYIINNQGTIDQAGPNVNGERAIKADLDYTSQYNQIINGAADNRNALIRSAGNDALRLGSNFTLTNYGMIVSEGLVNATCPRYFEESGGCKDDFSAADGVAIENERANVAILNHGTIIGPRHGVDGGDPLDFSPDGELLGLERLIIRQADGDGVTFAKVVDGVTTEGIKIDNPVIINYEGGEIRGKNGSGVGIDGHAVVINHGLISGNYAGPGNVYDHDGAGVTIDNGDGDGVDIDGTGYVENYGRIEGTGAGGFDAGGNSNGADGIAAGGGTFINHVGASIFGQAKGILVDDGAAGNDVPSGRGTPTTAGGVVRIENAGEIIGEQEAAIGLLGNFNDLLINYADGVIRGGFNSVRIDENDSETAAAAVQMGGGDDMVVNAGVIEGLNGLALDLGDGDDTLTVQGSGRFLGLVDGGSGNDRLILADSADGTFGNSVNFEQLEVRSGRWTLNTDDFSEDVTVHSGAMLNNLGVFKGNVQVDSGASYGGGQVGGNLHLASGATLVLRIAANGDSNSAQVEGEADVSGANLSVDVLPGDYGFSKQYNVLQANGGVSGTFANVSTSWAFLSPTLTYDSNRIDLDVRRNDLSFADAGLNDNARSVAHAVESQLGGQVYQAMLTSSIAEAGYALDQLAASSNASLISVGLANGAQVANSMRDAIATMGGIGNDAFSVSSLHDNATLLASVGLPSGIRDLNRPQSSVRVWLRGLGSHGKLDGRHGGHDLDHDTRGALLGADWTASPTWRLGVVGGYAKTDVDAGASVSADVDSMHLGIYALHRSGPVALRLGAAYSWHDYSTDRSVRFNGFSDHLRGDFDANGQQLFAELGYQLERKDLNIEPFVGLGYQRFSQDGYSEQGGDAALRVEHQDQDNVSSTLGVRLAYAGKLHDNMTLTPRFSVAWRHTFGTLNSRVQQAFLSGGSAFDVEGNALDRNSALVDAGVDLGISAKHNIYLGYSGEYGSSAKNHALRIQWQAWF